MAASAATATNASKPVMDSSELKELQVLDDLLQKEREEAKKQAEQEVPFPGIPDVTLPESGQLRHRGNPNIDSPQASAPPLSAAASASAATARPTVDAPPLPTKPSARQHRRFFSRESLTVLQDHASITMAWIEIAYVHILSRFFFSFLRSQWNQTVYIKQYTRASHLTLQVPLWYNQLRKYWILILLGFIFLTIGIVLIRFTLNYKNRPVAHAIIQLPRILSPHLVPTFVHQYKNYQHALERWRQPIVRRPGQVMTSGPGASSGTGDADKSGVDDDLESERDAELMQETMQEMEDPDATDTGQRKREFAAVPPVTVVSDELCPAFIQFDTLFESMGPRRGCWDANLYNIERFYNPSGFFLSEYNDLLTHNRQARQSFEAQQKKLRQQRERASELSQDSPPVICITNVDVGIADPFVLVGYEGENLTAIIDPFLLPLEPVDSPSGKTYLESTPLKLEQSDKLRRAKLQNVNDVFFQEVRTNPDIRQPYHGVRIRYKQPPPPDVLNAYYSKRFGFIVNAWSESKGFQKQQLRNDMSGDKTAFAQLLNTQGMALIGSKEIYEAVHHNLVVIRQNIEIAREDQRKAWQAGTRFVERGPLTALKIELDTPRVPLGPPPTLITREAFFPKPLSPCIMKGIAANTALRDGRQETYNVRTGYSSSMSTGMTDYQFNFLKPRPQQRPS